MAALAAPCSRCGVKEGRHDAWASFPLVRRPGVTAKPEATAATGKLGPRAILCAECYNALQDEGTQRVAAALGTPSAMGKKTKPRALTRPIYGPAGTPVPMAPVRAERGQPRGCASSDEYEYYS